MVLDALRGYIQLANGLTEVTRQRALATAKALAAQGALDRPAIVGKQVQGLADELWATSRANRDLLMGVIRSEIERAMGSMGVATADDVEVLTARLVRIERRVGAGEGAAGTYAEGAERAVRGAPAQRRPYVLLLDAMRDMDVAALGRMVIRGSEYICLIRPKDDALALETLFVAEDVYSQAEISEAVGETDVQGPELDLARQVIESLVAEFDGQALTSQYRQDLRRMLEAKLAGEEIARPEPVEEAPVIDLMDALRASVADAQGKRPAADESKPKRPARRRRAAAK